MEADVSVRVCSWILCGIPPDPAESRKIRRGQAIPRWFSGGGTRGTMRDRGIPATRNFLPDIGPGSRRIRVGPECSPPLRIGEASPLSRGSPWECAMQDTPPPASSSSQVPFCATPDGSGASRIRTPQKDAEPRVHPPPALRDASRRNHPHWPRPAESGIRFPPPRAESP